MTVPIPTFISGIFLIICSEILKAFGVRRVISITFIPPFKSASQILSPSSKSSITSIGIIFD